MESIHNLFDCGGIIPPMHVQDINVCRPELFERLLDRGIQILDAVTTIIDLDWNRVIASFVVRGELGREPVSSVYGNSRVLTFVAMTSCSRIPRLSIHSPRTCSDVSSWLYDSLVSQQTRLDRINLLVVSSIDEISTGFVKCVK